MSAAQTIKKLRDELNLTREQLASALHVTRATIFNYEKGFRKPNAEILLRVKNFAQQHKIKINYEDLLN